MSPANAVTEHPAASPGAPTRIGVVESDARDKTRKVVVTFLAQHPKYGKFLKRRSVIHAHDEGNESRKGDSVEIQECRPISKTKRWRVLRVVSRAQGQA